MLIVGLIATAIPLVVAAWVIWRALRPRAPAPANTMSFGDRWAAVRVRGGRVLSRAARIRKIIWAGFQLAATFVITYLAIHFLVDQLVEYMGDDVPIVHVKLPPAALRIVEVTLAILVWGGLNLLQLQKVGWRFVRYGTPVTSVTIRKYKAMARHLDWRYYLIDLIGMVSDDEPEGRTVWVNPKGYMRLHTAAAYLLEDSFASLYKGPKAIWDLLKEHGIEDFYPNIIKKKQLGEAWRYVYFTDNETQGDAIWDFRAYVRYESPDGLIRSVTEPLVNLRRLLDDPVQVDVNDFSAFGEGSGCIVIRVHHDDQKYLLDNLTRIATIPETVRREKELTKLRFRVIIQWLPKRSDPYPDRVQRYLTKLNQLRFEAA
jgi:hypothetical protein